MAFIVKRVTFGASIFQAFVRPSLVLEHVDAFLSRPVLRTPIMRLVSTRGEGTTR